MIWLAASPLLALVAGSAVYCVLTLLAVRSFLRQPRPRARRDIPLSVLKPLSGVDLGLEENLRSFFMQDYPSYELLFAVRTEDDPAVPLVRRLMAEHADVPARLLLVGEPPYPNAKVFSLAAMTAAARHGILVMADSDVRVTREMLASLAAEFEDARVGLVTCPYSAVPGPSFWTTVEALGMNTEFLAGALVARMLEGMKFALGPTIAMRRAVLEEIGGWDRLKDFLAEDFVMGHDAAERGHTVLFSRYVIEHHIGSQDLRHNLAHRLRWNRSTRRSRPAGYVGQIFTNPLPLALLLWVALPAAWPLAAAALALRAAAAWAVAGPVLHDPLTRRLWWLIPFQDLLSLALWVAGFFGDTIVWRGRRYRLLRDGRFELRS